MMLMILDISYSYVAVWIVLERMSTTSYRIVLYDKTYNVVGIYSYLVISKCEDEPNARGVGYYK